jgi:hypothetical protein
VIVVVVTVFEIVVVKDPVSGILVADHAHGLDVVVVEIDPDVAVELEAALAFAVAEAVVDVVRAVEFAAAGSVTYMNASSSVLFQTQNHGFSPGLAKAFWAPHPGGSWKLSCRLPLLLFGSGGTGKVASGRTTILL